MRTDAGKSIGDRLTALTGDSEVTWRGLKRGKDHYLWAAYDGLALLTHATSLMPHDVFECGESGFFVPPIKPESHSRSGTVRLRLIGHRALGT